ncbi:MAG: hypothetical protein ACJ8FY_22925 [Gemmataceae bacterium]
MPKFPESFQCPLGSFKAVLLVGIIEDGRGGSQALPSGSRLLESDQRFDERIIGFVG